MNIPVPVDGSDRTKRMLAHLAAHDGLGLAGQDLHFLTVVLPVPAYPARFLERQMIDGFYAEEAERVLEPIRAFADRHHWKHRATFAAGQAAETIVRTAEDDRSDLMVMGSHGHTALGNTVLGSVANAVLARCRTPMLPIR